jgi:hypothetical protein
MYPTVSNNAYYFAGGLEVESDSTSQPCPVEAPLVSEYDPWQQPKPFPATYDCWEPAASFSTASWMDVPVDSFEWVPAQQQIQAPPQPAPVSVTSLEAMNDLPLMDLPGPEELASTPDGSTPMIATVAPSGGLGGWADQAVTMPTQLATAMAAPSRSESAVFSLDEPKVVPGQVSIPTKKAPSKKRTKGTPDMLTTSPGPPVTIAIPKPSGDPERDAFLARVYTTNAHNGKPIVKLPVVGKIPLDLFALHREVAAHGGFEKVLKDKQWKPIALNLGISLKACTDYGFRLRRHYDRFLTCIDAADRAGGTTTPPPPGGKRGVLGTKKRAGGGGIVKRSSVKKAAARPATKTGQAKPAVRR